MRLTETSPAMPKRQPHKDKPAVGNYEISSTASLTGSPFAITSVDVPANPRTRAPWMPMPYTAPATAAKELHKRVENLRIYVTEMSTTQNFTTTDTGPIAHLTPRSN